MKRFTCWMAMSMAAVLSGCDEPTVISNVDKLPHMTLEDLWTIQDGRGIPVEIHGKPFRVSTHRELAESIRPPGGVSKGIKFYSTPVGSWKEGHAWRMVLHFNPSGPPNAFEDCKRDREAVTAERPESGYSVNVSFCKEGDWQAHGFLKVLESEDRDFEVYANAMATTLSAIFREDPGDQR